MVNNKEYMSPGIRITEILSYVFLIGSIVLLFVLSSKYKVGEVATHFNAAGEADAYDDPMEMIILPIIFLICNIIMSLMLRFAPLDTWNYPIKNINPAAAPYIYKITVWMFVLMMFFFGAMSFYMIAITGKGGMALKLGVLGFCGLVTLVIIACIVATIKINKKFI